MSSRTRHDTDKTVQFTVGKLDAGMAILLTEDHHLIEFPSLLLPQGVASGSIVNISVNRNFSEETRHQQEFWKLQQDIYEEFAVRSPKKPELRVRNITQTSVTLEWSPLQLETASLRSLEMFKNNQHLTTIHNPMQTTISKHSGLEMNKEYSFHLILRTTAGTYVSNTVTIRTHTINNLTGLNICFGHFAESEQSIFIPLLKDIVSEIGAKISPGIQIDTTHLLCSVQGGPEWKKAQDMSIPIVRPEWLIACRDEHKVVNVHGYYLGGTTHPRHGSISSATPQSSSARLPVRKSIQKQQEQEEQEKAPQPSNPNQSQENEVELAKQQHVAEQGQQQKFEQLHEVELNESPQRSKQQQTIEIEQDKQQQHAAEQGQQQKFEQLQEVELNESPQHSKQQQSIEVEQDKPQEESQIGTDSQKPNEQQEDQRESDSQKPEEQQEDQVESNSEKLKEQQEDQVESNSEKPNEQQEDQVDSNSEKPKEQQEDQVESNSEKPKEQQEDQVESNSEKPKEQQEDQVESNSEKPKEHQEDQVESNSEKPKERQEAHAESDSKDQQESEVDNISQPQESDLKQDLSKQLKEDHGQQDSEQTLAELEESHSEEGEKLQLDSEQKPIEQKENISEEKQPDSIQISIS